MEQVATVIRRTQLGDLPAFWAEGSGPFAAGLLFRVGEADETLARSGITHLVEHLALPARTVRGVQFDGSVDATIAAFMATGPMEQVLEFLASTAAALADPPLDRLETERRILRTEAGSRGVGPPSAQKVFRFGPVGPGLVGYEELGLRWLGPEDVSFWARGRFTVGNAALWMTSEPPGDLALGLVPGERHDPPEARAIPYLEFPACISGAQSGVVSFGFVAPRAHELVTVFSIAAERARHRVRYDLGLSYHVTWWYEPLTRELAHVTFWADCLDENAGAVADALTRVLDELADVGPTEEELAHEVDELQRRMTEPTQVDSRAAVAAAMELFGLEFEDDQEQLGMRSSLTPPAAAQALAEALETMLLAVPGETKAPSGRFAPYPVRSPSRVSGRVHRPRGAMLRPSLRHVQLFAGDDGISRTDGGESLSTVRFDECEAVLRWIDGTRGLWSRDGFYVEVDPAAWRGGGDIVHLIDERTRPELVVPMDRELEQRSGAVSEVAAANVKQGWQNKDELAALPRFLEAHEEVVTVANAQRGWKAGLLAVTDRRLLFLFFDEVVVDLPLALVEAVETKPASTLSTGKVVVRSGDEAIGFTIEPAERLHELVQTIEQRVASRTPAAPA